MKFADAIVVGGGFAGLSAAVALAHAGVRVQLFEARPTLGGRANTFRDPLTGERVDNGQHVLAGCYTETLAFLERIGSATRLHRPSSLRLPMVDEHGRRTELVFPALPAPLNLFAGILAWDALTFAERIAILRAGDALRGNGPAAPHETVRAWLMRHHQSSRLCRLFWEPLALAALNQSLDDAAAEMFIAVTSRMFGAGPEGSLLLVPGVTLEELYVTPALLYLGAAGARVVPKTKARILTDDAGVVGVQIGEEQVSSTTVICAVPWFALGDAFVTPPAALQSLLDHAASLGSAPIVTVNLWFDSWHLPDAMLGLPGRTFQWVFDRGRFIPHAQTHVSLISSGADAVCALSNERLISLARQELAEAVPTARAATLRRAAVVRERRATFSLTPGGPPRPATRTPLRGLFLAGDWIDTGLPATIESAVCSGHRAASEVIRHLTDTP